MMTIRHATVADVPLIVEMGRHFIGAEYPGFMTFSAEGIAALTTNLIQGQGVVFLVESEQEVIGMMAMTTYPHPMSGEIIATEIVWWVELEQRGGLAALRLLRAGELWAKQQGAVRFQMIAPSDRVGQFYERLGFERIEVHYQRALS